MPRSGSQSKKKKKQGGEGAEGDDRPVVFTLYQRLSVPLLQHVATLESLLPDEERVVKAMLAVHSDAVRAPIRYTASNDYPEGRLWAASSVGMCSKWICRLVAGAYYEWLDIRNSASTILLQVMAKNKIEAPAIIRRYVEGGHDEMLSLLLSQLGKEENQANLKWAKQQFNSVINGKRVAGEADLDCPVLRDWWQAWTSVVSEFRRLADFAPLWNKVQELKDRPNKDGTFIAFIWQRIERDVMSEVVSYLSSRCDASGTKFVVGVWKHDEIGVEKPASGERVMIEERVAAIAEHVRVSTGFVVTFHSDDMSPTEADWDKYHGPQALHLLPTHEERCKHALIQHAVRNKHVRFEGVVMQPHASIPGVYVKIAGEIKDYLNTVLADSVSFTEKTSRSSSLCEWFETVTHPRFKVLSRQEIQSNWISFRNATFDLASLKLYTWEMLKEDGMDPPFTDHFYDIDLDIKKLDESENQPDDEWLTPLWTGVLRHQMSEEMAYFFEVCAGCAQYPVGAHDDWQGFLYMVGDSRTGKGTVIKVVRAMKPSHKVRSMALSTEGKFGLSALYQKELIVIDDLPAGFEKALDQGILQRMVSGEMVPIEVKYKTGKSDHVWTTPQVWAGNHVINFKDGQGQFSARANVFFFRNEVQKKVPGLAEKIIQEELPFVLLRSIKRYRMEAAKTKGMDFWSEVAPEELRANKKLVQSQTNMLSKFLNEGSTEFGVVFAKNHITRWTVFEAAFLKFLKNDLRLFTTKLDDIGDTALRRSGFEVFRHNKKVNYCLYCDVHKDMPGCNKECDRFICYKRPNAHNCGSHHNPKRKCGKCTGIVNMKLVSRAEYERLMNEEDGDDENSIDMECDGGVLEDAGDSERVLVAAGKASTVAEAARLVAKIKKSAAANVLRQAGVGPDGIQNKKKRAQPASDRVVHPWTQQRLEKRRKLVESGEAEVVTADANVA